MENNKFTILITTYNRPEKIKRHLMSFESICWDGLIDCKPTIIIADDLPGGGLRGLCEEYQGKLKSFNLMYLERKKIYNEADYRIKCSFLKSSEIVDKILKLYEKSGN